MTMQSGVSTLKFEEARETLISFRNISKVFKVAAGEMLAVKNVSLDVSRGEIITLIGPSGCGKSTLLNMVAGMFHPTTGEVYYGANQVTDINQNVGYMTQNDHLLPWRTVSGNIAVPLEIQGLSKAQIATRLKELISLVKLEGFEGSYPSQISGGMKKRTALARLLAYNPDTLLLDEPFAALDAQLRLRMQIQLRELAKKLGKTVLFVTHDLDEAAALGDRCVVFTGRPGGIRKIVDIPLGQNRDLMTLRHDAKYQQVCTTLWDLISDEIKDEGAH